jgi:group I intron endonuclease
MSKSHLVYKFTSPSGKSYIGQTRNLRTRIAAHKSKSGCIAFRDAISKYGFESFTQEILKDSLTLDEANYWEKFYISEYNSLVPNGYNLAAGGENSLHHEETKKKLSDKRKGSRMPESFKKALSEKMKGNTYKKGVPLSDDQKRFLSEMMKGNSYSKGVIKTPEVRAKLSKALKGRVFSDETRAKISAACSGRSRGPMPYEEKLKHSRAVIEVTTNKIFDAVLHTRDYYGISLTTVRQSLVTGKPVTLGKGKGLLFKYCDEWIDAEQQVA